jgi:hypothetical protein
LILEAVVIFGVEPFTFDRILAYIGIAFTGIVAFWVYRLQNKTEKLHRSLLDQIRTKTKSIASITERKAILEQQNKAFECKRIIEQLQGIQNAEREFKSFLMEHNPTNETLKLLFGPGLDALVNNSISIMKDAIGQLENKLKDTSLRGEFSKYIGQFNVLPKRILIDNMPQPEQKHQTGYLLDFVDDQMGKIQHFIERFNKEISS